MTTNGHIPTTRRYSLTLAQRRAIDLLLAGKNDREVAAQLGIGRSTVARWRHGDPKFQTALDRRRAQLWPVASDHVRALLPTALSTMDEQLRVGPNRGRLALDFIFRAGLLGKPYSGDLATAGIGPTSLDDRLDQEVLRHRAATRAPHPAGDDGPDQDDDAPITEEERDAAFQRLTARLEQSDVEDWDGDADNVSQNGAPDPASAPVSAPVSASVTSMSSFR